MARISRLIIYESDDNDVLAEQIENSLPEGTHDLAVKITIINVAGVSLKDDFSEEKIRKLIS